MNTKTIVANRTKKEARTNPFMLFILGTQFEGCPPRPAITRGPFSQPIFLTIVRLSELFSIHK